MGNVILRLVFIASGLLSISIIRAQQLNLPLNHDMNIGYERILHQSDSLNYHSSFKPLIENNQLSYTSFQQANKTQVTKHFAWLFKDKNWIKRKMKWENLYEAKGKDFYFDINPLLYLEYGRDLANDNSKKFNKNGRGVLINGHLTPKVSFSTSFMENQMYLPTYLRNYSVDIGTSAWNGHSFSFENPVVPGQGRAKLFKTASYDFAYAQGYVSYSPIKNINLQFGNGKLFVGDGYRSIFLSDNACNYPYFRFTGDFLKGKLRYTAVWASLTNAIRLKYYNTIEPLYEKKAASFFHVSYQLSKKWNVGLFEGNVFRRTNNDQTSADFDPLFLNPVIIGNSVRTGFSNSDRYVLLGANFKFLPRKNMYFYGQLATDGPIDSRWAYQLGGKWFDAFKTKNLMLQFEMNHASRHFYSTDGGRTNYGHYNQPLGLTTGGGTFESILRGYYRTDDYFYEIKLSYQTYRNYDDKVQYGKDIYLPYGTYVDPAVSPSSMAQLFYKDISFGYILNPLYNMHLVIGWFHRNLSHVNSPYKTSYLYIGFRTSLSNFYYDI